MIRKLVFIMAMLILSISHNVFGGEAILTWDYPTTNTDGTALTDLGGFKLYYGTASGVYNSSVNVGFATCVTASPCSTSTYTITNLSNGLTYFAATAYDIAGNESAYSNEVSKTITGGTPPASIPAPTGIQVTANGGTVTVIWDKPNSSIIAGYQIQRGPTPTLFNATYDVGLGYASSAPCVVGYTGCARRQFIFNGVTPGTYFFRVTAYDSSGTFGEASSAASVTIMSDAIIPADVTNFSAVKYGTGTRLSWTNPSDPDFYGLLLEYSFNNSAGPWVLLANLRGLPGGNQTYDHLNLPAGAYTYRIHTKDTSGNITSTKYSNITLEPLPEEICPVAADFNAHSIPWGRNVSLAWTWPYDQNIITGTVEYRIASYQNRVLLSKLTSKPCWVMIVNHEYSNRLIGESIEYTLTLSDKNGKKVYQTSATVSTPKDLSNPPDGIGGGGDNIEWVTVTDNAATDFPKPQSQRKKESGFGFGCGTIKNIKPPDGGGGTDISAIAIVATVMFFIARRKLRPRIN